MIFWRFAKISNIKYYFGCLKFLFFLFFLFFYLFFFLGGGLLTVNAGPEPRHEEKMRVPPPTPHPPPPPNPPWSKAGVLDQRCKLALRKSKKKKKKKTGTNKTSK